MASTNSSLKCLACLLSATVRPQPASPQRDKTRPSWALSCGGKLPRKPYSRNAFAATCAFGVITISACFRKVAARYAKVGSTYVLIIDSPKQDEHLPQGF